MDTIHPGTRWRPWLARLSPAFALGAVLILVVFAGLKSVTMLIMGLVAAGMTLAAAFFFLSRRGVVRWLSLAPFIVAPIAAYAFAGVDSRSGGGKVQRFDLQGKAEALGAEVFLMDGHEPVDVAQVARDAVAQGADLLGVAGGDGTQALVAGVAAHHGIPFMVITAGTRNHFALDLGLDREDPAACLGALPDGVELGVDLRVIGDQTFVNNASFGAYAQIVESPACRDDEVATTLDLLPDLLQGHDGPRLAARAEGWEIIGPQALLVANNPYGAGDIAGLSRRIRLDRGVLGVVAIKVGSARQAAGLLRGTRAAGLCVLTAKKIEITADEPRIPVGIDGEAVRVSTPVKCTIRPGALRVWVPRNRPGIAPGSRRPGLRWTGCGYGGSLFPAVRLRSPLMPRRYQNIRCRRVKES
jgi:diacylglycerol kinase family enzyme